MNRYIITCIVCLFSLCGSSQINLLDPFSGKPYLLKQYDNISGSAYLFADWKNSDVTDNLGTTFLNVLVKFDLYTNTFFYNHGDTAYEFVTDIREVKMYLNVNDTTRSMIFKRGVAINKQVAPVNFVQVLAEGKVRVYKLHGKAIEETTEYNVPGKIKSFVSRSTWFYLKDGTTMSEKPGTKILESLTNDKWMEVEKFMKQNSMNAKNEADFIKLVKYYNSL